MKKLKDSEYAKMDADIRATVRWLRSNGFETMTSRGKPHKMDCECLPAVGIFVHPREVLAEADRLYHLLNERSPQFFDRKLEAKDNPMFIDIVATYIPEESLGAIDIYGPGLIEGWKNHLKAVH